MAGCTGGRRTRRTQLHGTARSGFTSPTAQGGSPSQESGPYRSRSTPPASRPGDRRHRPRPHAREPSSSGPRFARRPPRRHQTSDVRRPGGTYPAASHATLLLMERQPVSVLSEYLTTQTRVWVRLAANRLEADWQLALLEVTVGEPPPSWRRQRWSYDRAVFVASHPAGSTVAKWLTRERISLPWLVDQGAARRLHGRRAPRQQLPRHLRAAAMALTRVEGLRSRHLGANAP